MKTLIGNSENHKYQQIAITIEKLITDDVLKVGDKLQSVRILSKEQGISMSTAFQAYYHLEGRGLIESRPKSGYYVKHNPKKFANLPLKSQPDATESEVSTREILSRFYKDLETENIMKFSLALPPVNLLPVAKLNKAIHRALQKYTHSCIDYEASRGSIDLRRQITRLAFNWMGQISEDDIQVTSGCNEALTTCIKAATKPGDTVAIESPTYFGILRILEYLGLKAIEIPTDPLTGVDIDQLKINIDQNKVKACMFIPNFNNPLGSCMPDENKKALVDMLANYEIPLIEDDIYGELYFGAQRPRTCKTFDKNGMVLYCTSVSKSIAPGYRIGWTIPGKYLDKVRDVKSTYSGPTATVTQAGIANFLSVGRYDYHLKEMRKELFKLSLRYSQAITEYFPIDTRISRPQGGLVLWIELNKNINAFQLYQEAIKHNISIIPGHLFSMQPRYANCLRISFANPWTVETEKAIKVIGKIAKEMI